MAEQRQAGTNPGALPFANAPPCLRCRVAGWEKLMWRWATEASADAEPSLAAPENHIGTQVGWMRGNGQDREAEAPEPVLPEVAIASPVPKVPAAAALAAALAWGGSGNVISAAGVALLDLIERVG